MLEKVPHFLPHKGSSRGCLIVEVLELRPESEARRVVLASLCRFEYCSGVQSAVRVLVAATQCYCVLIATVFVVGI